MTALADLQPRETRPKSFRARLRVARSDERMYAIFEDGSHQFRVREGDRITVDRREGDAGSELVFSKVLLIAGDGAPTIGSPVVEGARVTAKIVQQFKDKKIIIQKFRRRKNMRRRKGHRQPYTTVLITGVVPA
jgi:large subunit ribosomal protein L21